MKKIIALLSLLLALCMVACSSGIAAVEENATVENKTEAATKETKETEGEAMPEGPHDPTGFATGFGKVVVNPAPGVGLGGFGNSDERTSTYVSDDICISCAAISDGEQKILLFSLDSCGVSKTNWNQVARVVEKELGVPKENIVLNASHSHSAPSIYGGGNVAKYMQSFYKGALYAAKYAVADLDKTEVKIAKTRTEGLRYIRRYIKKDTGEFVGNWPNTLDPNLYDHESYPDEQMQILYFDRANQKDIVLCNWQCHVTNVGTSTGGQVSSDYVGAFRDYVSQQLDVHCAFFQGAAGSTIPFGKLKGENSNSDYKKYGQKIGDVLIAAIPSLTPVQTGKIETLTEEYVGTVKPEKVSDYGNTSSFDICALAFGDVAIATAPYEMDHRNGAFVKDNSPYKMTFMSAYSNGSNSYIPAESSFPNEGYEVNSCRFVAGTGEGVASQLVTMLNSLYQ